MKLIAQFECHGGPHDGVAINLACAIGDSGLEPPAHVWFVPHQVGPASGYTLSLEPGGPGSLPYHLVGDHYAVGPASIDEFPVHVPDDGPTYAWDPAHKESPVPEAPAAAPLPFPPAPRSRLTLLDWLALAIVVLCLVGIARGQLGAVRVVNRTPHAHRNLAMCGATFPPGAVFASPDGQTCTTAGAPLGIPGAVASAVQPFGMRWPDGSVRYGRVFAVLAVPAGADQTPSLGPVPPADFHMSAAMLARAGQLLPELVVTRPDGSRQVASFAGGRADWLAANPAALVVRFRNRVPGTPLLWEITLAFGSDTDVAQWSVWVHNSDPRVPDNRCDFQAVELQTRQPAALYWRERLGIPPATPIPGADEAAKGTSWRLIGQDWLGDAQGLSWFEGTIAFAPPPPDADLASGAVIEAREEAQRAAAAGPLEMMHSGWATPGLYGPLGSCGALPAGQTVPQADAALTAAANAWAGDKRAVATWAEHAPFGEFSDTARTGEHPTHGVTKLADLCLTSNPRGIAQRRMAWLGETRRPLHRFEADLAPLTKARHPQWIAWSGTTHWVSQDKLGKPQQPRPEDVHLWSGPDPEHWMGETMLAPLALITADWRLLEQGRHRMEQLKGHGYLPLQNYAARSICWVSRAAAWWDLALGEPGDLAWTRGWLDFVVAKHVAKWQGKPGPVQPWVTMVDRRYFANPEREFWIVWQHQFLFGWLEAGLVANHAPALTMAATISRLCDIEGWDPVTHRPFGGQATKPGAEALTLAERSLYVRDTPTGKTDGMVTSAAGTDWDIWALGSLDIGAHFATLAGDQVWIARNAQLKAAVMASLTDATRKAKAAAWAGAAPVVPVLVR